MSDIHSIGHRCLFLVRLHYICVAFHFWSIYGLIEIKSIIVAMGNFIRERKERKKEIHNRKPMNRKLSKCACSINIDSHTTHNNRKNISEKTLETQSACHISKSWDHWVELCFVWVFIEMLVSQQVGNLSNSFMHETKCTRSNIWNKCSYINVIHCGVRLWFYNGISWMA